MIPIRRPYRPCSFLALPLAAAVSLAGCGDPAGSGVGSMIEARAFHSATLLGNGKVLFAGGRRGSQTLKSAELYDPETDTWSLAGPMLEARGGHTATLLFDGTGDDDRSKVLVAGGDEGGRALGSAELYDPETDTWSAAGAMEVARRDLTATLVDRGDSGVRVLVAGGDDGSRALASAELYDPETGTWSDAAPMKAARRAPTATRLGNGAGDGGGAGGEVLVAGGARGSESEEGAPLPSAELYDPEANTWSDAGAMIEARRAAHTATRLDNGKVLVAGGARGSEEGGGLASAELYDPEANTWSDAAPMIAARRAHTATRLDNGKVLVAGGSDAGRALSSTELYDPESATWSLADVLSEARDAPTATLLGSGAVVIAGGEQRGSPVASTELYQPAGSDLTCETTGDCPRALVCTAQKACEQPPVTLASTSSCAAAGGGAPGGGGALVFSVALLLAAFDLRRRRRRRESDSTRKSGARALSEARRSIQ